MKRRPKLKFIWMVAKLREKIFFFAAFADGKSFTLPTNISTRQKLSQFREIPNEILHRRIRRPNQESSA